MSDERDDEYWENYESGPFCRHWSDPIDCEEVCATCGHGCTDHAYEDGERDCGAEGCTCQEWKDAR